jgi:hypothetical protein
VEDMGTGGNIFGKVVEEELVIVDEDDPVLINPLYLRPVETDGLRLFVSTTSTLLYVDILCPEFENNCGTVDEFVVLFWFASLRVDVEKLPKILSKGSDDEFPDLWFP